MASHGPRARHSGQPRIGIRGESRNPEFGPRIRVRGDGLFATNLPKIWTMGINFLKKLAICLLPLALTPLWGFLISEGYLNFGGGCKDIILLIPWLLWSLFYSLFFIVLWIRGRSLGRLIAYSIAGAIGVIVLVWIMLFCLLWYPGQPVPPGDQLGY